jgi:hypothetical protein
LITLPNVKSIYIIVESGSGSGSSWPSNNIRICFPCLQHVAVQCGSLIADEFIDGFNAFNL